MTAVPGATGTTIELICDGCGVAVTVANTSVHDEDLVWTVIGDLGWAGSPFAAGRHSCARCATRAPGPPGGDPDELRSAPARFTLHRKPDAVVVAATGDMRQQTAEDLRALLATAIDAGRPVVLDLEGVNVVDSVSLGVLVRARQEARRREIPLCLAAPSRFVLAVLHTMRLRHAFPVYGSRAEAIAALTGGVPGDLVMRPS